MKVPKDNINKKKGWEAAITSLCRFIHVQIMVASDSSMANPANVSPIASMAGEIKFSSWSNAGMGIGGTVELSG